MNLSILFLSALVFPSSLVSSFQIQRNVHLIGNRLHSSNSPQFSAHRIPPTTTTTAILDVTPEPANVCYSRICQFKLPRSGKTSESSESARSLTHDLNTRFVRPAYAWCVAVRALFDTRPPYDDRIPKRRRHTKPGERERERDRKSKEPIWTLQDLISLIGICLFGVVFVVCTLFIGESFGERASHGQRNT